MSYPQLKYKKVPVDEFYPPQFDRSLSINDTIATNEPRTNKQETNEALRIDETRKRKKQQRLNTELLTAIKQNDIAEVSRLIKDGASPNSCCRENLVSACHLAVIENQDEILTILIENKALTGIRDKFGRQPHHLAAALGHFECFKLLLEKDKSLLNSVVDNSSDKILESDLDSFLHSHEETKDELHCMTKKSTALHIASKYGYADIVDFLIAKKCEIYLEDEESKTPLDVAGMYSSQLPGQIIMAAEPAEYTPQLPEERKTSNEFSFVPRRVAPAKVLRPAQSVPSEITTRTISESSATHARMGTEFTVISFLKEGISLKTPDLTKKLKSTQLHICIENRVKIDTLETLFEKNPRVLNIMLKCQDSDGRTPIHLATKIRYLEGMKFLLSKGKSVANLLNENGQTALDLAIIDDWIKGVNELLEVTDLTIGQIFYSAAISGKYNILKELLSYVEELLSDKEAQVINEEYKNTGYTPFLEIVKRGNLPCIKLFIEFFSRTVGKFKFETKILPGKNTIYHLAVEMNNATIITLIAENRKLPCLNYDIEGMNDEGLSPLHIAARKGSKECVSALLVNGASSHQRTSNKAFDTALHLAATHGAHDVIKIILNKNPILVNEENSQGRQALHLAAAEGHGSSVTTLLQKGADLSSFDPLLRKNSLDIILHSVPRPIRLLDDLLDFFMVKEGQLQSTDRDLKVKLDFRCLLRKNKKDNRQLAVLDAINNSNNERLQSRLFLHPLIETFLYLKWIKLKFFFSFIAYAFIIHIISLTTLALTTYVVKDKYITAWICRIINIFTMIPIIFVEFINFTHLERFYFRDPETWIKLSVIFSTMIVSFVTGYEWIRYLIAVAVLLAWVELLFLIPRSPRWGMYVLMFFKVASNVFEVFFTFVFLILGFVFCFLILFDGKGPFNTFWKSLCKVIIMMVELDYSGVFEEGNEEESLQISLIRFLYLCFVLLVVMVLTNLITSMSVSDVAELENQGKANRLSKQAAFLSLIERIFYNDKTLNYLPFYDFIKKYRSVPEHVEVYPNKSENNPLPRDLRINILLTVLNRDELSESDNLNSQVAEIERDIKQMYNMISEIHSMLSKSEEKYKYYKPL